MEKQLQLVVHIMLFLPCAFSAHPLEQDHEQGQLDVSSASTDTYAGPGDGYRYRYLGYNGYRSDISGSARSLPRHRPSSSSSSRSRSGLVKSSRQLNIEVDQPLDEQEQDDEYVDAYAAPAHPGYPGFPNYAAELWPDNRTGVNANNVIGEHKLEFNIGPCLVQLYEECRDDTIVFYLFRSVDGRPAVLSVENPELPEIFDPTLPTKVLIHGYAGSVEFNFTSAVRHAYLLRGGYNVLVVDWGKLTQLPCYPSSVVNTWQVSRCAGQLLAALAQWTPALAPPHLHVVGFSLGAHIAAYLSADLQQRTGMRVGRITGLDPALPAFASLSSSWKLDADDADFVDVVHTNAGVLGKIEPTGHADFYINGGSVQPFCTGGDRNIPLCSHLLAPVYFAESILWEQGFWGRQCPTYGHYAWGWCPSPTPQDMPHVRGTFMGEGADPRIHGTFIVETATSHPFAIGPPDPLPPFPGPSQPPDTILIVLA